MEAAFLDRVFGSQVEVPTGDGLDFAGRELLEGVFGDGYAAFGFFGFGSGELDCRGHG